MSGARVRSSTPRNPSWCSHTSVAGASSEKPGASSVLPIQPKMRLIGPKSQTATASWCQPWSNTSIPRPSRGLLELPVPALRQHVPSPATGVDDLHREADRVADLARPHDVAQLQERRVERVVLEHAQEATGRPGRREDPLALLDAAGDRLLQLHVEPGFERLRGDVGVERRRHEHVDDVRVDAQQLVRIGGEQRVRAEVGLPAREP